jgi:hypothetical protein
MRAAVDVGMHMTVPPHHYDIPAGRMYTLRLSFSKPGRVA